MNPEQILKRMNEIAEELKADGADVEALGAEFRTLQTDLRKANLADQVQADIAAGVQARHVDGIENPEAGKGDAEAEKRGKDLKEARAVSVDASNLITPKHTSNTINETFNTVSTLIDGVQTMVLPGGEAFSQPYIKGYGEGDYTNEGADYADAEPVFGYAEIGKTKVTAYAEITEEARKLPAANYDAAVQRTISIAKRRKITREILLGDGTTGHFTGIFHNPSDATKRVIDPATDLELEGIDVDTLDDIIFGYGGEEDVEDDCVLILNKKDLRAFAKLRGPDKKKLHDIKKHGNRGTIDEVPYIIHSACNPVSDTKTATGKYCMAYGPLSNYMKVIFSDAEIQKSEHFKFKTGNIAHRGSVMMGGNVVAHNGFLRVKKAKAGTGNG